MLKAYHLVLSGLFLIAACGEKEIILEGDRLDHRAGISGETTEFQNRVQAVRLGAAISNDDWTHKNLSPDHAGGHLALADELSQVFVADVGQGNTRRARISADPVASYGVIYVMDSLGTVSSVSNDGTLRWQTELSELAGDNSVTSGGGLAIGGGKLLATTGFGEMIALDLMAGTIDWRQDLNATGLSAPTVLGDFAFVVDRESTAWAVNVGSGRIEWSADATPSRSSFGFGASVAANQRIAVIPFASGEISAVFPRGGLERWSSVVRGQRLGSAASTVSEISGDPVIVGDKVYVGNFSGRIAALDLETGERVWTALHGATGPIWPAGDDLFAVNDLSQLIRLDARNGEAIWAVDLPDGRDNGSRLGWGRDREITAHYGPVLAGGRLIVASSDGFLRSYNPVDGVLVSQVALPSGAASRPIVVGGTLFVVTTEGQLAAFR